MSTLQKASFFCVYLKWYLDDTSQTISLTFREFDNKVFSINSQLAISMF